VYYNEPLYVEVETIVHGPLAPWRVVYVAGGRKHVFYGRTREAAMRAAAPIPNLFRIQRWDGQVWTEGPGI
jgi:hypothetical protein